MTAVLAFLLSNAGQTVVISAVAAVASLWRWRDKKQSSSDFFLGLCEQAYAFVEKLKAAGELKGRAAALAKFIGMLGGIVQAATGKPMTTAQKARAMDWVTRRAAAEH